MDTNDASVKQQHFHAGHIGAVALGAAVLIFMTWMKSGFDLHLKNHDATGPLLTYEQARAEVLAENGITNAATYASANASSTEQLAMLDPSLGMGSVLGASTGTPISTDTLASEIPAAEQLLTPQILNGIPVKVLATTSQESVIQYQSDVDAVEAADNVATVMANLTSQDAKALNDTAHSIEVLLQDLLQVDVPQDLVKYHRVKLLYYNELRQLAQAYAGDQGARDSQDLGLEILSLTDYLNNLKQDIFNKYGVQF
jgi:hypothetical protein